MKRSRSYNSDVRQQAAEQTRTRILDAARKLFARSGVDPVTIAQIAERSEVGVSTVYALFESKAGILRALMSRAIFSDNYQQAASKLEGTTDPRALLRLTAGVARTIYESEAREIGLLRGASVFSKELKKLESEFEGRRYELQRERVELLFSEGIAPEGLSVDAARHILWMYTSRDVYRMLVVERGWTADQYERWLAETIVMALTVH